MNCKFTVNRFRYNHRNVFRVRSRSVAGESSVGLRLYRGEPMPAYKSQENSEKAAAKMLDYHDRFEAKCGKRKRRRR